MVRDEHAEQQHPYQQAVRRLTGAFTAQDRATIEDVLDPACTWRVPGRNGLAGEYVGRPAVMGLFTTLRRLFAVPAQFEILDIAVSEDRAIAYQVAVAVVGDRTVRMKECMVYRFRDGKVVEVDEFQFDQATFDEVFSASVVAARTSA